MNILFIDTHNLSPNEGGAARVIDSLTNYFINNYSDIHIHLAYFKKLENKEENKNKNITYHKLYNTSFDSLQNKLGLKKIIVQNRIDILVNNTLPDTGIIKLCSGVKKEIHIKLISIIHSTPDYVILKLKKQMKNYSLKEGIRNKAFVRWFLGDVYLYALKKNIGYRFKLAYISSDAIIVLSPSYKKIIITMANLKSAEKILTIPNPIDERFMILPIDAINKKKQIVFIGRLHPEKGVDRLISIWAKLHSSLPAWNLLIVGDGEARNEYEKLSIRLMAERIEFIGFQDSVKYINESAILCLTSDYEGFPLVLIEAMNLGTIPLSFNNYKASTDIIDSGINGFLIPAYDLEQYCSILYSLATNEQLRINISKHAKTKAKYFSIDKISKIWVDLFYNLIN
jgi:glycosyltransferase involved in cell wall biosynthesis